MPDFDKLLQQLVEKLVSAHGRSLVSVVLYGSAAGEEHHAAYSDLNVFCVLAAVTPTELAASEPVFTWWRNEHQPAPLLMSEHEMRTSTDCFPIEFKDMLERRKILYGADVVTGLEVDEVFYRAQVEHDLRAKLLRVRQKAAGVLSNSELLLRLMADSLSTFCVLAHHALHLTGEDAPWGKRDIATRCAERFGMKPQAFYTLLDLREGRVKPRALNAPALFATYLEAIGVLVDAVDKLDR